MLIAKQKLYIFLYIKKKPHIYIYAQYSYTICFVRYFNDSFSF